MVELNSSTKGNYGEMLVATWATGKGYYVGFMPQQCPYDLVIDKGVGPKRIQVKAISKTKNGIVPFCLDVTYKKNNNRIYSSDNIDYLAIVEPNLNIIAWIPSSFIDGKKHIQLRIDPSKNGQIKNILWFSNFSNF